MFAQFSQQRLEKYFLVNLSIIFLQIAQHSTMSSSIPPSSSAADKHLSIPDFLVQLLNLPNLPDSSAKLKSTLPEETIAKLSKSRKMRKNGNNQKKEGENESRFMQRRPICPYQFVLNERQNRVPRTLVEVKCLGRRPLKNIFGNRTPPSIYGQIECRPMHWNMRVLDCQKSAGDEPENADSNLKCREAKEQISLACVPMVREMEMKSEEEEEQEEDGDLIQVPAKPFDENEQQLMEAN